MEDKLKLYVIDINYIKYLQQFDKQVLFGDSEHYIKERKYLGVVLKIDNYEYFAPLSPPKESDYFYKQREKLIRKSSMTIIRLVSDKGVLLGKIKLNNMIPVPKECLTLYDLDNEPDTKYKDLVTDELVCIRKNKKSNL